MPHWFIYSLKFRALHWLCLYLCLSFFTAQPVYANLIADQTTINNNIQHLEKAYIKMSNEFYQSTLATSDERPQPIVDIDLLHNVVLKLSTTNQSIKAIQLIYSNIETIQTNLDSDAIFSFIELLLNNNEWQLANSLHERVINESNQSMIATVAFIFAKYYSQHHEWTQVYSLLKNNFSELSEENTAYAYLLNGTALQHLKKHRQAIKSYKKVPVASPYYRYAQLNIAIANIRLGWLTDAQIIIKKQLTKFNKSKNDELTNRLYLVLGYALLQREYYRDARNAFRHIGLNSRYTNRALLGIGLTATSQGDYIGALNALTILKDKKTFDLSVDESYLLVPYIYEKLQQEITVTTSSTEAMNYYQKRINILDVIASEPIAIDHLKYDKETSHLIIKNNSFDYGSHYPESFINNIQKLNKFLNTTDNHKLIKKITALITKFKSTYKNIISNLADERKSYLKSYLNQSRYGLARLYDNSKQTTP